MYPEPGGIDEGTGYTPESHPAGFYSSALEERLESPSQERTQSAPVPAEDTLLENVWLMEEPKGAFDLEGLIAQSYRASTHP